MTDTLKNRERVLSTDPVVSMDIAIGKKLKPGEVVNVDYPALRETLVGLGAPQDNSRLSLHYSKSLGFNGGDYSSTTQTARIKFKRRGGSKRLKHELAHYADLLTPPSANEERTYAIGQKSIQALYHSLPPFIASYITTDIGDLPAVEQEATTYVDPAIYESYMDAVELSQQLSLMTVLGATALIGIFYYNHKQERIAKAAEKMKLPRVLTVDKP